jgi:hypothetical protein
MASTVTEEQEQTPPVERAATGDRPAVPVRVRTRVHVGEMISAGNALVLLVLMFATKWYGVAGVPDPSYARPAVSTAENGWDGLTIVRWLALAAIAAAVGSVFLHASQREHGVKTDTSRVVTALGSLAAVLLAYRVLIALPGSGQIIDQKLGAVLGVLCAAGIACGGIESIGERRALPGPARHRDRRTIRRRDRGDSGPATTQDPPS